MQEKICKACGRKLSEFYKTGMLGCEHCYEQFKREIDSALQEIQGSTCHIGKKIIPSSERELLREYESLIKEKERATINGEFSIIGDLNKEIEELYNELERRGLI